MPTNAWCTTELAPTGKKLYMTRIPSMSNASSVSYHCVKGQWVVEEDGALFWLKDEDVVVAAVERKAFESGVTKQAFKVSWSFFHVVSDVITQA